VEDSDVVGAEVEEGVDEVSAPVAEVDVDSTSKAKEEDVTADKLEAADGVDSSELATVIAVDTTITFVDDEDFADAEDGFAVDDLQSPKPA
jgi:hypothetical protein